MKPPIKLSILVSVLLVLAILGMYSELYDYGITGLITTKVDHYKQEINLEVEGGGTYNWILDEYEQNSTLTSLKATGYIKGNATGYARAYLVKGDKKYLILSHSIESKEGGGITGYIVGDNETNEETSTIETTTTEETSITETTSTQETTTIETTTTEETTSTVGETTTTTEENLTTTVNTTTTQETTTIWENITTTINETATTVEENQTSSTTTIVPENQTTTSEITSTINETSTVNTTTTVPENVIEPITVYFEDECMETCELAVENLSDSSYKLEFELENVTLKIDELSYYLEKSEEAKTLVKLDPKIEELLEKGKVRVIIKIKDDKSYKEFFKKDLYQKAKKMGYVRELKKFNFISVLIDKEFFDQIKNSTDILEIKLDEKFDVLLNESLPIIRWNQSVSEFGLTGQGKSICMLDSGVDSSLVSYSYGYDFINNDNEPEDNYGHGTKVAAVIKSISPEASLYVAKVLNDQGTGYESDVLAGLQWCIDQNPDVISFSIGSGSYDGFCDENLVADLSNQAFDQGIFVVAAAGNDGDISLKAPACGSKVFSVGATDDYDQIASFSSIHPTLDMFAPGVDITTNISTYSGTSFSTPHVSASALLILENEPLNVTGLKYRLRSTGKPIPYPYLPFNISRLDLYKALTNEKTMEPYDYSWYPQANGSGGVYTGQILTTIVGAIEDTYVGQAAPESTHGSEEKMWVDPRLNQINRMFIQFTMPTGLINGTVTSAYLDVYYFAMYSNDPAGRTHGCRRITSSWDEDTLDWDPQPSLAASDTATDTVPASPGAWMNYTVTDDVKCFANETCTNYGWRIRDNGETTLVIRAAEFVSTENTTDSTKRPTLRIDYTRGNGAPCSSNSTCASNNCVYSITALVARYCAASGKECSRSGDPVGYDTGETYTSGGVSNICKGYDLGGAQCGAGTTGQCDEYANKYCNGAATWVSGSSNGVDAACNICTVCGGTAANNEGDLSCNSNVTSGTEDPGECHGAIGGAGCESDDCACDGSGNCDIDEGTNCTESGQCVQNNCRREIDSSGYYCAASTRECSEDSANHQGYEGSTCSLGTNGNSDWLCRDIDSSVQCGYPENQCDEYCSGTRNSKYCNGVGSWIPGDSEGMEAACQTCMECPAGKEDLSCTIIKEHEQDTVGLNTCTATCKECDGKGNCADQPEDQDYFDQCDLVECDGDAPIPFYWGWLSLECFYRNDTSKADARCDGRGKCKDFSQYCPNNPTDGSTGTICDCSEAQTGCSGTTSGTCNNNLCPPKYWDNSTNSTVAGQPVEFRLRWTDNIGLSSYIFSLDNCTGSFANLTNGTFSGTENWSNVTRTVSSVAGCLVRWKIYANDTNNNWNVSEEYSFLTSPYCGCYVNNNTNLDHDITGCTGTILYINKSSITFDCQNHYLQSSASGPVPAINNTNFSNVTIKNCRINMSANDEQNSGIYFSNCNNSYIENNTLNTQIYLSSSSSNNISKNNVSAVISYMMHITSSSNNNIFNNNLTAYNNDELGVLIDSSYNNTVYNNKINSTGFGTIAVYIVSSSNNTISNNNISTTQGMAHGIQIEGYTSSSSNNKILNNNIITTGASAYGILLYSMSSAVNYTNVIGGSVISDQSYDYFIQNIGSTNSFQNTNFTAPRDIYFYDNTSWFNYNNATTGGVWLNTSVSATATLTRKLTSYNQNVVQWNDTNTSGTKITATYKMNDLYANTFYKVYNNSVLAYTIRTDSAGFLNFTIYLDSEHEIKVEKNWSCGDYVNSNVNLDRDITGCTGTILYINASSITLDCQNHYLQTTGNYSINNTGFDNVTIKNCVINGSDINSKYGIYYSSSNNGNIQNNTVILGYNAIYLDSSSNNIISNNNAKANESVAIQIINSLNNTIFNNNATAINSYYAISIFGSSNNNVTNNNATANNWALYIAAASSNNIISNNNVTAYNTRAIDIWASSNNNITGGSIKASTLDYYLHDTSYNNSFRDTNFTAARQIYFGDSTQQFNYNNQSSGGIWLKTSLSTAATLTRKLINWNQTLVQWNDTNSSGTEITVTYNVSDLAVNDYYNVYNNSVLAYSLKTDSSGVLPSFTIYLGSEHEIKVKENQPIIIWENPTPSDGAIWNYNWVYLNATIIDDLNTSAFFDWNYSLRGYWSFDYYNSTGIFDNSTYNNFGTFQSGLNASNITTGKYGNALKFDGFNDYLDCSNDSEFGITTNLTIEAWINGTNKQNISQNIYVVAKPFSYGLRVYNDTGNPNVGMIIRNSSNSSWYGLDTGANVLDSNWHQLVGVYNGSAIKIYIDGVLNKTSSPIIDTIFVSTDILRIGSYTSNYGNFNGIIDEVRLYNRALSSEEINASYNNGLYRLKHNFTSLSDGNYSYAAWSIDQIGLMKNSTRNLILDTTFPIIVIQSPQNITYPNNTIWFNVSLNEPGSWCGYSLNGATNVTMSNDSATHFYKLNDTLSDGSYHVVFYCNDTAGNTNSTEQWFSIHIVEMDITKALIPNVLVVMENETVNVTTDVKINRTSIDVYQLNVTDEIPYDFINYSASQVKVYFINYSSSQTTEITGSVSVSIVIPGGTTNKYVSVNVTNSSVGGYIKENDTIRLNYLMNSSQMELDEIRTMWTNATAKDVSNNQKSVQENFSINAAATLLRGWKDFYFPDIGNTQLITFRIFIEARGGPIGEIYVSDYVPPGASPLSQDNITVTYVNTTKGSQSLTNGTDYLVKNFSINTLPDGSQVSVYLYNFTYNSTPKWDTYLYDKENITIEYNVTIIGGGQWTLPTIISGFDPTTGKEIKTEMYTHVYVPLFDITIKLLTERVKPGNLVRAVLNMLNVGGPKAKVDVALFYSIKDRENNVLVEASDTFAVNEGEERELSLPLPEDAESGIYNFEALAKYVGREAVSSKPFTVEKEESSVPYVWILVIVALLVTVILVAIWRTRR